MPGVSLNSTCEQQTPLAQGVGWGPYEESASTTRQRGASSDNGLPPNTRLDNGESDEQVRGMAMEYLPEVPHYGDRV